MWSAFGGVVGVVLLAFVVASAVVGVREGDWFAVAYRVLFAVLIASVTVRFFRAVGWRGTGNPAAPSGRRE